MTTITNRYDFVLYFDVENGNPNGDPDAGNMPRIDPETGLGLVTDVCLKRKIRNYVELAKEGVPPYCIYIQEKAVLNIQHRKAYDALRLTPEAKKLPKKEEDARAVTKWMCSNFFDIRTFGAVMATEVNCGQVRGPVQLTFARSIDPIVPCDISITRMAVTNEKDLDKERTMGRKYIVPYALYRAEGFVSAPLAEKTGFSQEDLELLWDALINMFEHDHSATRGKMSTRKLFVFQHAKRLGNAPAQQLFDMIQCHRVTEGPARSFSNYNISIEDTCPSGVTLDIRL